jgi:hypothetical protein
MTTDERDLKTLGVRDADPDVAKRLGVMARGAFEEEHELRKQALPIAALHRVSRLVFPAAVAGAIVVYLSWAVGAASALYP